MNAGPTLSDRFPTRTARDHSQRTLPRKEWTAEEHSGSLTESETSPERWGQTHEFHWTLSGQTDFHQHEVVTWCLRITCHVACNSAWPMAETTGRRNRTVMFSWAGVQKRCLPDLLRSLTRLSGPATLPRLCQNRRSRSRCGRRRYRGRHIVS